MGQCVLRDCGFKFDDPEQEKYLRKIMSERGRKKKPISSKFGEVVGEQEEEDDEEEAYRAQKRLKKRLIEENAKFEQLRETMLRTRQSTLLERGTQTIETEIDPADMNVNTDDRPSRSYSQTMISSDLTDQRISYTQQQKGRPAIKKLNLKDLKEGTENEDLFKDQTYTSNTKKSARLSNFSATPIHSPGNRSFGTIEDEKIFAVRKSQKKLKIYTDDEDLANKSNLDLTPTRQVPSRSANNTVRKSQTRNNLFDGIEGVKFEAVKFEETRKSRRQFSRTIDEKPRILGFDNEYFRADVQKFIRSRSPSPMNVNILPDDLTDDDDQQTITVFGNRKQFGRSPRVH